MTRASAHPLGRLAALLAALAMLVLAAGPAPARAAAVIEVCTAHGVQKVLVDNNDAPAMPGDCEHCGHCVLVSPATVEAPSLALPVRYAEPVGPIFGSTGVAFNGARAPPRPLGQAPPVL